MVSPLKPEALTAAGFAPFGDVLDATELKETLSINYGQTQRYHRLASVDIASQAGPPIISIFRSQPVSLPFTVAVLERHPLGSQAFMPLSGFPYLVVVAPPGKLDMQNLKVFLAGPGQGVNYHRGTWHHYNLALQGQSDFLVVDGAGAGNFDEIRLPVEQRVSLVLE